MKTNNPGKEIQQTKITNSMSLHTTFENLENVNTFLENEN